MSTPSTDSKDKSVVMPKILQRHYSTIGIQDVFLVGPPHPLPCQYLATKTLDSSFDSWEIVGTIKESPEDFCVREIFQRDRPIPGLGEEDRRKLQVATILEPNELPQQRLDLEDANDMKRIKISPPPGTDSVEDVGIQDNSQETKSSATIIRSYIERALNASKTAQMNVDKLIDSLNNLHEFAIKRVHQLSSKSQPDDSTNDMEDTIMIPPLILEHDTESAVLRKERGEFHRALKTEYPMLYSNSVTNEGVDYWIAVKVDDSYDGLVPYLVNPANDIRALLSFKKQGLPEERTRETSKTKSRNSRDAGMGNTEAQVILVLQPRITKEERKSVHHLIADRSKLFRTSTITDYKLQDGTITTAIAVQWDKSSIGRKRKRQGDTRFESTGAPDPYNNVLAVLKKRQKEHLTALNKLTQVLRCSLSDIGIAGIKDLQAVTYQFCTFRNMKVRRLQNANQQLQKFGMELGNFYRVNWVLNNGDLDGNDFRLIIRGLKRIKVCWSGETVNEAMAECEHCHIVQMVDRVKRSGFINFFGEQRVGSAGTSEIVGVRAFDIGRAMLQGDFSKAIDLIMLGRNSDDSRESDAAKKIRQTWQETSGDPAATLKAFHGADNILSRERMVLKGLSRYGRDHPLEAIRCLSHSVRTFWINAYQSYIWNQVASARIQRHGKKPVKGDLYQDNDSDEVKVLNSEDNSVSLSQVVLPLPGFNIRYPENDIADLYTELLRNDAVTFEKSALAESSAKGGYRRLVVHPMMLTSEMTSSDVVQLSFQLPKGCYATMFLRELMLTTGTR